MKTRQQHDKEVEEIRQETAQQYQRKQSTQNATLTLTLENHLSNTTRSSKYKQNSHTLGVNKLNQFITIDHEKHRALVEPRVTMEQLHAEIFKKGFIVPVIPEFKGITIGGAIMGAAIESSSHSHGQFNDICTGYEVLLGNGTILWTSPEEHPELFFSLPGSYGSLGTITLIEIKLIPATDWIQLTYHPLNDAKQALTLLLQLKRSAQPPDYLEGIVFSSNCAIVVEGQRISSTNLSSLRSKKKLSLQKPWSPWYYQHLKNQTNHLEPTQELISVTDYFFRHDRGAFWMGAYAVHFPLFFRYLTEGVLGLNLPFSSWEKIRRQNRFSEIKDPGLFFRSTIGWMMSSHRLYGLLHSGSENWFENKFVIQDFYLPEHQAEKFLSKVLTDYAISPIWLCPVRASAQAQLFSPHSMANSNHQTHDFIDIGLYGLPKNTLPISEVTKDLEQTTSALGGRKMLYSHSYFKPEEFWKIYSFDEYQKLRKKYYAEGIWLSIEDKVLKK